MNSSILGEDSVAGFSEASQDDHNSSQLLGVTDEGSNLSGLDNSTDAQFPDNLNENNGSSSNDSYKRDLNHSENGTPSKRPKLWQKLGKNGIQSDSEVEKLIYLHELLWSNYHTLNLFKDFLYFSHIYKQTKSLKTLLLLFSLTYK